MVGEHSFETAIHIEWSMTPLIGPKANTKY